MDVRTRILEAAAGLLSQAPEADISTRAVCEAAGVGAPALYRQFGDKEGLLSAVVDYGFEQYLSSKRAAQPSDDPVRDLRDGWDNHVAFAVDNPNYYRLMWSPGLSAPPEAAAEAHRLLLAVLERCAAAGRLRVSPETAADMVMSANSGVALSLISRPAIYADPEFSTRVRDAVIDAVTVPPTAADDAPEDGRTAVAAATLGALLRDRPPAALTEAETALLREWLGRLSDTSTPS
ncbi:TetR/AcrR family transcriptional regulator [Microbispora sp. ATCC PTA-5024]|uniref:TetR/AcrR family transcriptional regulator n=1 Tax=Microbispora sp. ATCC PTA-5024 TaxID=316330 RepID=UPI0003DCAB60|nr:TetR/AcrR family transcriptional regulator [Microbispora sp. ATCC PTA-5024]ETK31700.1 TetR family transcriptional regulator [Microbispora sp. ATCC PTA-5024]